MLDPIFNLFATAIAFFYQLTHNYAVAIALLTVCVMILLLPLTLKGTKSMLELQKLQPEIRRLQQEFRGDRQRMNEEMMKLYQEHKINPLGGCLPLLLQAPVFIILFNVLSGLTRTCTQELVADGVCAASQVGGFAPKYLQESSELYRSLLGQTKMMAFGLDLARPATDVIAKDGLFWAGVPYLLLVVAVAATSYYQQRQISARSKGQVVNPQQQMIMRILPGVFAVFSLTFRAGLVVYFLTSNVFRIGQQAFITRRFYRDRTDEGGDGAKPAAPPPKPAPSGKAKPTPTKPSPAKPAPKPRPSGGRTTPPKSARPAPPSRPTPGRPHPKPAPKKRG